MDVGVDSPSERQAVDDNLPKKKKGGGVYIRLQEKREVLDYREFVIDNEKEGRPVSYPPAVFDSSSLFPSCVKKTLRNICNAGICTEIKKVFQQS